MMTWHNGPQTVEALMESYHVAYLQSKRHRRIDKRYPPEQWLQSVLDKGYTILNYIEYVQYMDARVKMESLTNLKEIQLYANIYSIPESDIESIKERYLSEHLLFLKRKHAMERATDESVIGGFHIGDKVLPVYRDRAVVYVQRTESAAEFLGTRLNAEQRFNLIFRGIEPEGIEVIYIDKMGNRLTVPTPPITREELRSNMSEIEEPPPEEWWDPNAPIPASEDFEKFMPPENTDTELKFRKQRVKRRF